MIPSYIMQPLAKTTFGTDKAHIYLVDTLNKLDKKKVTAKCMAMISPARGWASRIESLWRKGVLETKEVGTIVRLYRTDQGVHFSKLNAELDEKKKAWEHVLSDEGYRDMELEHLAMKLTMNIAAAPIKDLAVAINKARTKEISEQSRVRYLRSKSSIDTAHLGLSAEQEIALLKQMLSKQKTENEQTEEPRNGIQVIAWPKL